MMLSITAEEAVELRVALTCYKPHARNMSDPAALANTNSLIAKVDAAKSGERPVRDMFTDKAKARLDAAQTTLDV